MQNCIGGHANVLYDYKKTWPPKILKIFHSICHHLIDMLTKFGRNHILPALFKRPPRAMPVNVYKNIHVFMRPRGP